MDKRAREQQTMEEMIKIYCHGLHHTKKELSVPYAQVCFSIQGNESPVVLIWRQRPSVLLQDSLLLSDTT